MNKGLLVAHPDPPDGTNDLLAICWQQPLQTQQRGPAIKREPLCFQRRGWDSNPRYSKPYTRFRV